MGIGPLSASSTKWSNALKQFVGKLPTNRLSVLDHFLRLAFKGLIVQRSQYADQKLGCILFCDISDYPVIEDCRLSVLNKQFRGVHRT